MVTAFFLKSKKMSQLKQVQFKQKLVFTAGSNSVVANFTLPIGFISHAVAYTNDVDKNNGVMLSLAFKDDENLEVVPPINIRNWEQRAGGTYLDSLKPLGFDTLGRTYKLECSQGARTVSGIEVEVVFFYSN